MRDSDLPSLKLSAKGPGDLKVNVALMILTLCAELGRTLDYLAFGSLLLIFL